MCVVRLAGVLRRPRLQPLIAIGECSLNLVLLLLGVLAPIFGVVDTLLVDPYASVELPHFGPAQAANALLAGGVLWLAFQRAARQLHGSGPSGRSRRDRRRRGLDRGARVMGARSVRVRPVRVLHSQNPPEPPGGVV